MKIITDIEMVGELTRVLMYFFKFSGGFYATHLVFLQLVFKQYVCKRRT